MPEEVLCEIGGVDDGTVRLCCSTHQKWLCLHHYAITHFVETFGPWMLHNACNATPLPDPTVLAQALGSREGGES